MDRSRALPGEDRPVPIARAKWQAALPDDAWPRGFAAAGHAWRQDVFDVAERWRDGLAGTRQLLAATLMWTFADQPAGRRRARRMLDADPTGDRLDTALAGLRGPAPGMAEFRAAYLALRTTCRLPELDADTSTRLLYFAGYRRGAPGVQPLILDAAIAARIPASAGVCSAASRGTSLEWVRYLSWAAAQAGEHVEPDRVELDLSAGGARYGQAASQTSRVGRGRHARR